MYNPNYKTMKKLKRKSTNLSNFTSFYSLLCMHLKLSLLNCVFIHIHSTTSTKPHLTDWIGFGIKKSKFFAWIVHGFLFSWKE